MNIFDSDSYDDHNFSGDSDVDEISNISLNQTGNETGSEIRSTLVSEGEEPRPSHPVDPDDEGLPDIQTDPLRVEVTTWLTTLNSNRYFEANVKRGLSIFGKFNMCNGRRLSIAICLHSRSISWSRSNKKAASIYSENHKYRRC